MAPDTLAVREILVCASGVIYWAGVALQAARIRRRIGHSPNLKPRTAKERLLWLGWFAVILTWIGQPLVMTSLAAIPLFVPVRALSATWSLVVGFVLVAVGHAGTYWSYASLGQSWRIGVNKRETLPLVTTGIYSLIRHPIYSMQIVILVGAALLIPTPLSFAALVLHLVCSYTKAFDEERYLLATHAEAYAKYLSHTGRFLPKVRRAHP
jgi:protein-S-isoprenylcysteine O-methyltransferase Ste14